MLNLIEIEFAIVARVKGLPNLRPTSRLRHSPSPPSTHNIKLCEILINYPMNFDVNYRSLAWEAAGEKYDCVACIPDGTPADKMAELSDEQGRSSGKKERENDMATGSSPALNGPQPLRRFNFSSTRE